jgi:hypothetical protein
MTTQPVPEIDVTCAVAIWLHSNGWQVKSVSLPRGQGINQDNQKEKLWSKFKAAGISPQKVSSSEGPDIEASCGEEMWKIECKGLGNVTPQTLKNNFDRAVASAVSYYNKEAGLRVGLALPESYIPHIQQKLPQALRQAINLWIFLYITDDEVLVWAPHNEFGPFN